MSSSRTGFWRTATVVAVPLFVVVLALGISLYVRFFLPKKMPVRDTDRLVLVTVRDIEPFLKTFTPRTDFELLKKTRHPSGMVELRYEYLHPEQNRTLYVVSVVEMHPDRKSAREAYAWRAGRELPEVPYEGVALTDVNGSVPWADSARIAVLSQDGKPRGHAFVCRQEEFLLWIEIFGWHTEDESFQDLVFSRLEELDRFRP